MLYMVTFTINIPQMLAYIPYMDPMGIYIYMYHLNMPLGRYVRLCGNNMGIVWPDKGQSQFSLSQWVTKVYWRYFSTRGYVRRPTNCEANCKCVLNKTRYLWLESEPICSELRIVLSSFNMFTRHGCHENQPVLQNVDSFWFWIFQLNMESLSFASDCHSVVPKLRLENHQQWLAATTDVAEKC